MCDVACGRRNHGSGGGGDSEPRRSHSAVAPGDRCWHSQKRPEGIRLSARLHRRRMYPLAFAQETRGHITGSAECADNDDIGGQASRQAHDGEHSRDSSRIVQVSSPLSRLGRPARDKDESNMVSSRLPGRFSKGIAKCVPMTSKAIWVPTIVATAAVLQGMSGSGSAAPSAEPAGTIAFVRTLGWPRNEIFLVDALGRHPRRVTHFRETLAEPAWSPDGHRLAFEAAATSSGRVRGLWVMNRNGSGVRRITRGESPSWSPDAKRIAFSHWKGGIPRIFIANADGSRVRELVAYAQDPAGRLTGRASFSFEASPARTSSSPGSRTGRSPD